MDNFTSNLTNITTTKQPETGAGIPPYIGYIAICFTVFFWGSFFIPIKKFETGDGLFYSLSLCLGAWTVTFVINWIRDFPTFYALPMLCGLMWTSGNMVSVPCIKFIGLSLGPPLWDLVALIVGWTNARFGLIGNEPQVPSKPLMNYFGVAISALSGLFFLMVKPEVNNKSQVNPKEESDQSGNTLEIENPDKVEKLSPVMKRVIGVLLASFAGVMYGLNYAPILYVINNYEGASPNDLDYVFSFGSGILMASIFYFLVYCVVKKNKPVIYQEIIFPGFIAGCMWSIANSCYLIASASLSQAIVAPIGMSCPPMLASLYGIILFKEIKGIRNLGFWFGGFLCTIIGSILSGLSS